MDYYQQLNKIKDMTIDDFLMALLKYLNENNNEAKMKKIYQCIFNSDNRIDYLGLYSLMPILDIDDISFILKYDKDYKVSFLLALVEKADEEDLTKQAIYLLRRHSLNYIRPLLPYVDEEEVSLEYNKLMKKNIP